MTGGGLSPVPGAAADWWRLHVESWHPLGQGTAVPAPAYILPLAVLATVLGGTTAAVTALMVLAVPIAFWGAWRLLRVVGHLVSSAGAPRALLLWGAATYALVPVTSGAWGDGRFGTVAVAALLPWLTHAALGFADPDPDRRWRAAWRTALLLALASAFTPVVWIFAVLLGLVVVAAGFAIVPGAMRDRSVWGPPAASIAAVPVLLAPWWLPALLNGAAAGLLLDAGRPPAPDASTRDLLTGRLGDLGAPWWLGLVLFVLAALALVPRIDADPRARLLDRRARGRGRRGGAGRGHADPGRHRRPGPRWASSSSCSRARSWSPPRWARRASPHGWPPAPGRGAGWWHSCWRPSRSSSPWPAWAGSWPGRTTASPTRATPASRRTWCRARCTGDAHGILVVRGSVEDGLTYTVRRGDGVTLGEDEIVALSEADEGFSRDVRTLVSRPTPQVVAALAGDGIEYVVLPAPADGDVAAALDATGGLTQASAEDRSTRAWQVGKPVDPDAVDGPQSYLRIALLVLQGIAILVVAVLCAPTTERREA